MMRRTTLVLFCAFIILSCATVPTKPKVEPQNRSLAQKVDSIIQKAGCRMGVSALDLRNGNKLEWNADEKFESASVIKIAILAEALARWREGRLNLDQRWSLSDKAKAAGSGVLNTFDPGLQPTNLDLLRLMIILSDNTATNHWIEEFGFDKINQRMEAAGLEEIRLLGKKIPVMNPSKTEEEQWDGVRLGEVTPNAVANYFRLLHEGELMDSEATKLARDIFSRQRYTSRIPRLLLENPEYKWEGKTGTLGDAILDSGLLTTPKGIYALAIFADRVPDTTEGSEKAIQAMGDIAYEIVTSWEK